MAADKPTDVNQQAEEAVQEEVKAAKAAKPAAKKPAAPAKKKAPAQSKTAKAAKPAKAAEGAKAAPAAKAAAKAAPASKAAPAAKAEAEPSIFEIMEEKFPDGTATDAATEKPAATKPAAKAAAPAGEVPGKAPAKGKAAAKETMPAPGAGGGEADAAGTAGTADVAAAGGKAAETADEKAVGAAVAAAGAAKENELKQQSPEEKAAAEEAARKAAEEAEKKKAEQLEREKAQEAENQAWKAARRAEFDEKVWKPWLWPFVALVSICLATSLLLGLTNHITKPLIEQNTVATAQEARRLLLPEADSFEEVAIEATVPNVTAMYKAQNGAGYIVEAFGRGYGGQVPVMVAFDSEGSIIGVHFLENGETPGLGKKLNTDPSFAQQFAGMDAQPLSMGDIDKIASSTISTGAAISAVNSAIQLYNAQVMGAQAAAQSPEEVRAQLLPGEALEPITINAESVQRQAWRSSKGNYIIYGEYEGARSVVVAAVAMDANGTILNLWLDTSGDSPSYGGLLATNQKFKDQFIGKQAPVQVDVVAGTTNSSNSVMYAVNNALAALPQAKEAS